MDLIIPRSSKLAPYSVMSLFNVVIIIQFSRRLLHNTGGVSAIEFALILPVGLILLYGIAESGYVILLDRKLTSATQSAGDLVAQETSIADADLDDIVVAVNNILRPYPVDNLVVTIASVSQDSAGTVVLDWIFPSATTATSILAELPPGLLSTSSQSVIVSKMSYIYTPNLTTNLFSGFTISDTAYLRPRNGTKVAKP